MIISEKTRQNYLTVSHFKLDMAFSGTLGKSSLSIMEYIFQQSGKTFNVAPFMDNRYKIYAKKIQNAVDGTISPE